MKLATTTLVACVGALLALGLVTLYSAGMWKGGDSFLVTQLAWCGLGLVGAFVAALVDYRLLKKVSWLLVLLAVALLVCVWFPVIGKKINGAHRWIGLGTFRLQPSEFAKVALLIALAHYGDRFQRQMRTFWRGLILPGLMIAVFLALIFVEPDWGTTLLLAAVSGMVLLIAGVRWYFFMPLGLGGAAALAFLLVHNPVRWARILAFWDLEAHKQGVGYQAYQAMLALGSGGWWGLGLGNGRQKLGFVPEHQTDFVLSIIGEELGLVATLAVVLAFVVLVICGIYIAWNAPDPFGFLLGSGLTLLIGFQAAINIGVVTSVLPNKGLPLPFISYGGSNLLIMLCSIGCLLSIARRAADSPAGSEALLGVQPAGLPY